MQDIFRMLGFSENEMNLYLSLGEAGKATAHTLSKRVGVPRTTVYSVLEALLKRGLVSKEQKEATTFYVANKPAALLNIVKKEHSQLKHKEERTRELIDLITPLFKSKFFSIPRIQFFEGHASIEAMLYEFTPDWRSSSLETDGVWWGYQDASFVEKYRPWLEWYWGLKTQRELVQLLSNETTTEKGLKGKVPGRTIRQIPADYDFSSSIWVVGSYIILLMTRQEPQYAFQLRDPVLAANLRLVFKLLWERV